MGQVRHGSATKRRTIFAARLNVISPKRPNVAANPFKYRKSYSPRVRSPVAALTASFRAMAPGVVGFQNCAFLRGGMIAAAPRAAITLDSVHGRGVNSAPSSV